jgi:hypothetical protein
MELIILTNFSHEESIFVGQGRDHDDMVGIHDVKQNARTELC